MNVCGRDVLEVSKTEKKLLGIDQCHISLHHFDFALLRSSLSLSPIHIIDYDKYDFTHIRNFHIVFTGLR